MYLDSPFSSYQQKFEISHSLVGKWPSKNKGTRDASVGRSNVYLFKQLKKNIAKIVHTNGTPYNVLCSFVCPEK